MAVKVVSEKPVTRRMRKYLRISITCREEDVQGQFKQVLRLIQELPEPEQTAQDRAPYPQTVQYPENPNDQDYIYINRSFRIDPTNGIPKTYYQVDMYSDITVAPKVIETPGYILGDTWHAAEPANISCQTEAEHLAGYGLYQTKEEAVRVILDNLQKQAEQVEQSLSNILERQVQVVGIYEDLVDAALAIEPPTPPFYQDPYLEEDVEDYEEDDRHEGYDNFGT